MDRLSRFDTNYNLAHEFCNSMGHILLMKDCAFFDSWISEDMFCLKMDLDDV